MLNLPLVCADKMMCPDFTEVIKSVMSEDDGGRLKAIQLWQEADDDDSGLIDFQEFENWWYSHKQEQGLLFGKLLQRLDVEEQSGPAVKVQAEALFEKIDDDESGILDAHELQWALRESLGSTMNPNLLSLISFYIRYKFLKIFATRIIKVYGNMNILYFFFIQDFRFVDNSSLKKRVGC